MIDNWNYTFTTNNECGYLTNPTTLTSLVLAAKEGYGVLSLTYFTPSRHNKLEGLKEVVKKLFEEHPELLRVTMFVPRNLGKARALVKDAGFRWEGELRDGCVSRGKVCGLVVYGMTREDFEGGRLCLER